MKKYRFKKKIMVLAAAALITTAVVACGKKANEGNTTYIDLKAYYGIENGKYGIIIDGDIESISKAIGKNNKAVIGIKDINFSNSIQKKYNGGDVIG